MTIEDPTLRLLNPGEIKQFRADGYLTVPNVVDQSLVAASVAAICDYMGANIDNPDTWFGNDYENWDQVPIHHPQAFWDVRQDPRVHALYADLWGTPNLWVSIDRASFKPPISSAHPDASRRRRVHWDVDPLRSEGHYIQGLVYLTDTPVERGAFLCVPSIFRRLEAWFAEHGAVDQFSISVDEADVVALPGKAGDMVVWDSRMPHSAGENHADLPRFVQYVQQFPPPMDEDRNDRIACWQGLRPPPQHRGWIGQQDPEPRPVPSLTVLGERLLGLRDWD